MRPRLPNKNSLLSATWLLFAVAGANAVARAEYFVNGQQVSAASYQAFKQINFSIPLIKQNKMPEAIAHLQTAVAYAPTLAEAHSMYGLALARVGKTDEAIEQLRMAIASKSDLMSARLNLAGLYQTSGHLKDAVEAYDQYLKLAPDSKQSPAIRERLNLLHKELNSQDAAWREGSSNSSDYLANVTAVHGRKRWPKMSMPLQVYVYPPDGLNEYKPQYEEIMQQSFAEWKRASKGKIDYVFTRAPEDADITFKWLDDAGQLQSSAEGGEADWRSLRESMTHASIGIALSDNDSALPLTDNLVRDLCLHEIGHALGLVGHSARAQDVMFCTAPIVDRERHLSKRDVNTINAVYDTDVDHLSRFLFDLNKRTHGNALAAIRIATIAVFALVAALLFIVWLYRRTRGKSDAKKKVIPRKK